jgi:uroporphyrinogen-III decarboxylase
VRKAGEVAFVRQLGADPMLRGAPCPVRAVGPEVTTREWNENGRQYSEIITPVGALRSARMRSDAGNTHFLVEHPLKTEADYKVQLWIEENTRFIYAPAAANQELARVGEDGLLLGMLLPRGKSAFQMMVEYHVGTEEVNYHLADFPGTVRALWRAMVENNQEAVRLAAQSDYDYFITWEDSSTQNYSPTQYDEYIGSEIGAWCRLLRTAGKKYIQHACGHTRELVARMKAHGAAAVESMSPPPTGNLPLKECRQRVGGDFGIIGGIEPVEFLSRPLAALGDYVEAVLADGSGGPFVLANSDSCPPGVTIEKFRRVAEVARHWRG